MRASRWLLVAMLGVLGAYLWLLGPAHPHAPAWFRDLVLGNLVFLLPSALLLCWAYERPETRRWALPVAAGIFSFFAGNVYYLVKDATGGLAFPSLADAGYLATYPFLLTGLLLAVRAHLRGARLIVALDGFAGFLAGASLAVWAVAPLIDGAWDGSLTVALTLAYPSFDILLVSVALGALAIAGVDRGRRYLVWVLGMILFAMADVVYAYRVAFDTYQVGTILDGAWAVGLAVIALGTIAMHGSPARSGSSAHPSGTSPTLPGRRSLAVVAVAACAAVVVLAAAPAWSDRTLPSALPLATLTVCGMRFLLAFRQLRELAAVRQQALTDELTGAANRRALYAALDDRLARQGGDESSSRSLPGGGCSLALIDLDHFKEVNDSFGHAAGDALLRAVVDRFETALDQLATPHLLARLGGDEFAVLLPEVDSGESAMACGLALQAGLVEPVVLDDVVLHVRASIGLALAPEHAETRSDMLFAADAAMYAAKTSADSVSLYSPAAVGDRRKRLEVAEDLYSALARGELTVEYQPIMTAGGHLQGAEALVRWDHPTRGRLSPAEFLEVAERYRLTPSIAARVLDVALADLGRWRGAGTMVRMSVNVSASDLRDDALVDIVASALLKHGIPPSVLTIEITETAMMSDPLMARSVMAALHELGVQLAIDDYGTGYSSLEYLLKLPINEIKLDRAFSAHLVDELRSVAIVRSTVDLTHALGLRMVAEGVENEHTLGILQELECDLVQGWHLGRPMPAEAFEAFVAARLTPDSLPPAAAPR